MYKEIYIYIELYIYIYHYISTLLAGIGCHDVIIC